VVHACKQIKYQINQNRDYIVNVSKAAKDSWGETSKNGIVIHNPLYPEAKKSLLLVSATRIGAPDKGENDRRYIKLAKMLNEAGIPFVWLNFCDKPLSNPPQNFINMSSRLNIQDYVARADYLVQLSDVEAYSMSILEALVNNTPVICTPIPSAMEQGVEDGVTGYIVPYDMKFDVTKLLTVPEFKFKYSNDKIKAQWNKLLKAKPKPKKEKVYNPDEFVNVVVLKNYRDMELNLFLRQNESLQMKRQRAEYLAARKPSPLVKILEG
jgi:glycosyltransferase involved in cell wall biosynthesis